MPKKRQAKLFVSGICPSCKTNTRFKFIGVQEWHPDVAKKLNVPSQICLYRCESCDSCINEFALHDDSATVG